MEALLTFFNPHNHSEVSWTERIPPNGNKMGAFGRLLFKKKSIEEKHYAAFSMFLAKISTVVSFLGAMFIEYTLLEVVILSYSVYFG